MEKREIYTSVRKVIMILISYVLIGGAVGYLVFTQTDNMILRFFGIVIDVIIVAAFIFTARKLFHRTPLFVFDENGVTDYSKPEDVITLPWTQLVSVGLKAANSNDLMLNIVGYKTADQIDVVTPELRQQLEANDNKVYYALEVSGLWAARKNIRDTFEWMKETVPALNSVVQFVDFEDPLSKLGKKY